MKLRIRRKQYGFTLIEMAISLGILGLLTLAVGSLMMRTVDTYGQMTADTDTIKQARHCLEMISREVRESANTSIHTPAAGAPLGTVVDALLLTSARNSSGTFCVDASNFPSPQSIILFYLNITPEGITQLVRHQLYYAEDLSAYTPPFALPSAINPYIAGNIVFHDNVGNVIPINRTTGTVAGTPSLRPPKVLMNRTISLDIVNNGIDPIEARIACQVTDQHGRTATTRLRTQVEPRNM